MRRPRVDSSDATHPLAFWGTFDTGKPRVRMLMRAARLIDPDLPVCHRNPWNGIEDKSQVTWRLAKLGILVRLVLGYPRLILGYLRLPPHRLVIVPYLGNLDVLILWPLARLRGARICWDMFISLYDTVVIDRGMFREGSIRAHLLYALEWLGTRAADVVLMDTEVHARYVADLYRLQDDRVRPVWVGVETDLFRRATGEPHNAVCRVLFYGQFIPLHGLTTLVEAIHLIQEDETAPPMQFTIIGTGQEREKVDRRIADLGLRDVERATWVNYEELPGIIASSDICLGIFAGDGKATRVIPNKVFQIMAVGRPLVTGDTPAIREIVQPSDAVRLARPGDPADLARTLTELARELHDPQTSNRVHRSALSDLPAVDEHRIRDQLRAVTESLA